MGNTCFLNATLQCITHTVPLFLKLRATDHSTPCSCMDDFMPLLLLKLFFLQMFYSTLIFLIWTVGNLQIIKMDSVLSVPLKNMLMSQFEGLDLL